MTVQPPSDNQEIESSIEGRLRDLIQAGEELCNTQFTNSYEIFSPTYVNYGHFTGWRAQSRSALGSILGESDSYVLAFDSGVTQAWLAHVQAGISILQAVIHDTQRGYLTSLRSLITADVFTDFLEMADHLLENSYKDPAAMLIGAVLEDGLRRIASSHLIEVRNRDDLGSLSQRCSDAGVFNRIKLREVQVWIGIRNHADHGEFDEYGIDQVRSMSQGVSTFLSQYLI